MRHITLLLAVIAVTVLVGCSTTSTRRDTTAAPAVNVTVSVTCSEPRMKFIGTIVSDGRSKTLSGTGSGTFQASGHHLVCSFRKTGAEGRISLSVSERGSKLGDSSTPAHYGGVRAEFLRTTVEQHDMFTTF